jgi:ferric-dicitrate binding protein FerR (iron transport regulator)
MSDSKKRSEEAAERALREGFKVNVVSAEALQRIRQATEKEWRETTRPAGRRRSRVFAVAASILGVTAAAAWMFLAMGPAADSGAVLGEVAVVEPPGLLDVRRFAADVMLGTGSSIRVGQRLDARGDSVVNLAGGGNLRLSRASAIGIQASDAVDITRGEIYVDIPPGAHDSSSFRVLTIAGEFRHVGTQFAVMTTDGQTRLRVREGEVIWRAAAGDSTVAAGTEVTIDRNGKATRRQIPTAGREWAWTEAIAPDIVIENRPLFEFLQWFARETGRKLEIDDSSRTQAMTILMHGSVKGLTVTEALSAVMATTTTLKYELPEGVIRISSTRDSKIPRT